MITRENIKEVVNAISYEDKIKIASSNKDYVVLELNTTNCGYSVDITLTNNYLKYQTVNNDGNCILSIDDPIFETVINM